LILILFPLLCILILFLVHLLKQSS